MPELPEVETVARGLRAALVGRTLTEVDLRRADFFSGDRTALAALAPAQLSEVRRAGKYLVLVLKPLTGAGLGAATGPGCDNAGTRAPRAPLMLARAWGPHSPKPELRCAGPYQLMLHLGMTGQLVISRPEAPLAEHTHAVFSFGDRELRFRDPRRFGCIALALAPADAAAFAPELHIAPGREPLEVTAEEFVALFGGRQAPIKNALMNQRLLRGLGNIYCDEALFRAGIHPLARAISKPRLLKLRLAIRRVVQAAIAAGGSSISDYVDSRGEPGTFHLSHRVYGRTGEACLDCGRAVRRMVLGGRSAHYCPRCQRR